MNKDPRIFPCMDDAPENNGNGYNWPEPDDLGWEENDEEDISLEETE